MKKTDKDFFFNQVKVEITHHCNMSCCFCYLKNRTSRVNPMSYDLFKKVVQRLRLWGIGNIRLSGGEPLLHKDLSRMLSLLIKNHFRVRLITNGDFLTNEFLNKYKKKIYSYHISFHSFQPKKLKIVHMMDKSGETYCLNTVINPVTVKKIDAFFNEIRSLKNLAQWALLRELPSSLAGVNYKKTFDLSFVKKINRFIRQSGVDISFINPIPLCVSNPVWMRRITEYKCFLLNNTHLTDFTIDCDGNILPCPLLDLKLGNILDPGTDIRNILSRVKMKARLLVPETCRNCADFNECLSGCRAASLIKYGVLNRMDPMARSVNVRSR